MATGDGRFCNLQPLRSYAYLAQSIFDVVRTTSPDGSAASADEAAGQLPEGVKSLREQSLPDASTSNRTSHRPPAAGGRAGVLA